METPSFRIRLYDFDVVRIYAACVELETQSYSRFAPDRADPLRLIYVFFTNRPATRLCSGLVERLHAVMQLE